jgi:hypothetical protein
MSGTPEISRASIPLSITAFVLLAASAWLLLHLYWGIQHDAVLYTMQGLAHLHPDFYANDVFLRYGSQDRYSLFGALYGQVIGALGVDHAAALMTLLSQIALLLGGWSLARRQTAPHVALLSVTLLAVLELPYGSGGVFTLMEDFVTPRELSEGLALGAIAAMLSGRRWLALALLTASLGIHPLMALGAILWAGAFYSSARSHGFKILGLALLLLVLMLAAALLQSPVSGHREWAALAINRAPYLVLSNWTVVAWSNLSRPIAALLVLAVATPDHTTRRLTRVALGVSLTGLLLTFVGADWLRLLPVLQLQPWRWTWIAVALSALMLPLIVRHLWSQGLLGRTALALLLTVYFFEDEIYAPLIGLMAVVAAWLAFKPPGFVRLSHQRLIFWGAVLALVIGVGWDFANRFVYAKIPYVQFAGLPPVVTTIRRITRDSFFPALLMTGCWWLVFQVRWQTPRFALLAMGLVGFATTAELAVTRYSFHSYPSSLYAAFSPWRQLIAPGSEVLWTGDPLKTWIYLERPTFFADQQLSTTLFSQTAANVLQQRFAELQPILISEGVVMSGDTAANAAAATVTLGEVCAHAPVQYVVTRHPFLAAPLAVLPKDLPMPYGGLKLFECRP